MLRLFRTLSRAVFLACAMLALSVSAHASGTTSVPPSRPGHGPRLFASVETKRALGPLVAYIPQWATMDVMVVSHEDIARYGDGDPRTAFERFARTAGGFPVARLDREGLDTDFVLDATDGIAHAFPLPARQADEKPACAISLPDMATTSPDQLVSAVSDLAMATPDHLPGSVRAWRMIIIGHELRHCRHSYDDQRAVVGLEFEREADQFAIDLYRQYATKLLGEEGDPAVPEALVALRGVAGLRSEFIMHSTSAALQIGEMPLFTVDPAKLGEAKQMAQNAVWSMAETGRPDRNGHSARRPRPSAMYSAARALYDSGYFEKTPLQKRFVQTFLEGAERFFPGYFQVASFRR